MDDSLPGWTKTTVQEIATIIRGSSPRPQGDPRYYGGKVPRLMGSDVTRDGKYVTPKTDFLTEEGAKLSRPLPAGTLTIVCSGLVGVPSILAIDACIHDGFLALKDVSQECHLDFLYYTFLQLRDQLDASATHGGIFTNLTTSILKEFQLSLPPLDEQRKIADILSTWDEAIDLIGRLIIVKQKRKQALVQRLLTGQVRFLKFVNTLWQEAELGAITTKVGSGITPTGGSESYLSSGIPLIRSQNVLNGSLSLENVAFISQEQHQKMYATHLKPGDVLLNITGASIGRSCVVPYNFTEGNVNQHVCIIRPSNVLNSGFLSAFLNSYMGQKQISAFQAGGNRQGLNYVQIRSFKVPMPSLGEQVKISEVLDHCDKDINLLQQKLAALRHQKKGLMQQLLTGKIRVKV